MIAVVQRVCKASVAVDSKVVGSIKSGLLILLGIGTDDTDEDITWLSSKIVNLRIFNDSEQKMNLSLKDVSGELLVISQFTLFAQTKKGNRPSFTHSAKPNMAIPLYHRFIDELEKLAGIGIETGIFGADMKVDLLNDGPVTIIIDSKNKK